MILITPMRQNGAKSDFSIQIQRFVAARDVFRSDGRLRLGAREFLDKAGDEVDGQEANEK